ncbi:MAG: 30S ribosomal protein S16 [Candidatus Saganbacteria bacterium]|nr:30S ribosomal protein S16 [Candidatus Saganbacteria bacterium]
MAAKIKLQRKGTKNRPYYRVVVQDESAARNSSVVDILGKYDPIVEPTLFEVDKDKTLTWLEKGAEPTEKVRILLGKAGLMPAIDLAALPKRKPKAEVKAEAAAEGKPAEAKPAEGGKAPRAEVPKAEAAKPEAAEKKDEQKAEVKKEEPKPEVPKEGQ